MSVEGKNAVCTIDPLGDSGDDFFRLLGDAHVPSRVVDDERIEAQVARSRRWRYPEWPSVCEASDRCREKRHRRQTEAIEISEIDSSPRPVWLTFLHRYWFGGLLSVALHTVLLITLGVHVIHASFDTDEDVLYVIGEHSASDPAAERLQIFEISVPSRVQVWSAGRLSSPLSAPTSKEDPGTLPPAISLATFADVSSGPVGEVRAMFGKDGLGLATVGAGEDGADFFGVRATGSRFVFIVDCSRSMVGKKWEDATGELLAAVDRLTDDKFFYVVFFDGESHRMFGPQSSEPDLVPATEENVQRFRQWLATVELGFHTRPAGSVAFALTLQPDAIYLLSDGEFEDQTAALLRDKNLVRVDHGRVPRVIVHTIGFHSRHGQEVLERIAKENGGRYTFVPAPELAKVPGR